MIIRLFYIWDLVLYCICFQQQLYDTEKYIITSEDDGKFHKLEITNPVMADMGKYTCDIDGVSTSAKLTIEGTLRYIG